LLPKWLPSDELADFDSDGVLTIFFIHRHRTAIESDAPTATAPARTISALDTRAVAGFENI
jgi:hypothetical protein